MSTLSRLRGDRGSAVVEFALVTPLLLLVALAVLQVTLALHVRSTLTAAAAEGARAGALAGAGLGVAESRTRDVLAEAGLIVAESVDVPVFVDPLVNLPSDFDQIGATLGDEGRVRHDDVQPRHGVVGEGGGGEHGSGGGQGKAAQGHGGASSYGIGHPIRSSVAFGSNRAAEAVSMRLSSNAMNSARFISAGIGGRNS